MGAVIRYANRMTNTKSTDPAQTPGTDRPLTGSPAPSTGSTGGARKPKAVRDWQCQECGKRLTLKQAEKAAFADGCPKCGGSDIDLMVGAYTPEAA